MQSSTIVGHNSALNRNPRRQPAHLSVSLRHDGKPNGTVTGGDRTIIKKTPTEGSSESNDNTSSSSNPQSSRKWFNKANENPKLPFSQALQDEAPYFLPQGSVRGSDVDDGSRQQPPYLQNLHLPATQHHRSGTNASSASGFRSVIDDLTVENKRLKQRLRRLEKNHSPQLENERLFEVTIHGLSASKRRQLEEKLREFTATLEDSSSSDLDVSPPKPSLDEYLAPRSGPKRSHGSSNSASQPPDSAYASMSTDLQASSSNVGSMNTGRPQGPFQKGPAENADTIRDFLQGIPEGLLPKGSLALTERQKQRIVVRRLEQLFTGKKGLALLDNQLAQQQEVSDIAARADDFTTNRITETQGLREAHMLPQIDTSFKPGNIPTNESRDDIQTSSDEYPDAMDYEQEQRPTRPLDLDPDRAQVAADNVEYIRHLGLSTPQLQSDDSSDAEPDAQGWVYLNLLINMAQLHIINVTPDFVRRAVKEVSQKLQISEDGHKLRWRGGSKGTKLSSADDTSTGSPNESENIISGAAKRRKGNSGRFAAVPVNVPRKRPSHGVTAVAGFHYQPMFNHQSTSTDSYDNSKSGTSSVYDKSMAAETGMSMNSPWAEKGRTLLRSKRRRDDGTMVFYSNAHFCTDLAGDREIPTPVYLSPGEERGLAIGQVLGAEYSRSTQKTQPMVESVKTSSSNNLGDTRLTQSDLSDVSVYDGSPMRSEASSSKKLQEFPACGLGGTQPADHFVVRVRTQRTHNPQVHAHLSKKIAHSVPQACLKAFAESSSQMSHEEHLTANMASLSASSPSANEEESELPVEVEYLSSKYTPLEPSRLPEPMGYFGIATSEDDSASDNDSMSNVSYSRAQTVDRTDTTTRSRAQFTSEMDDDSEVDESEDEDDDDDMSIDMLGHLRKIAPAVVAARENSFDMRNDAADAEAAVSAAATVAESGDES